MSDHTPGPWLVTGTTVYALNEDGFNRFNAHVQDAHTPQLELEANARVMSMAPQLLLALEDAKAIIAGVAGDLPVVRTRIDAYERLIDRARDV